MNTSDQHGFETLKQGALATVSGGVAGNKPPPKKPATKPAPTKKPPAAGGKHISASQAFPSMNPQNVGGTLVTGAAAGGPGGALMAGGVLAGEAAWDAYNDWKAGYDYIDF